MKLNSKMEIIGFVLMAIGGLFWFSKEYYVIEQLNSIYSWARILFFSGLAIWALGFAKREAEKKKEK